MLATSLGLSSTGVFMLLHLLRNQSDKSRQRFLNTNLAPLLPGNAVRGDPDRFAKPCLRPTEFLSYVF
jgi:hypothetical protein